MGGAHSQPAFTRLDGSIVRQAASSSPTASLQTVHEAGKALIRAADKAWDKAHDAQDASRSLISKIAHKSKNVRRRECSACVFAVTARTFICWVQNEEEDNRLECLADGMRVQHSERGPGVLKIDMDDPRQRPYIVTFDGGDCHHYSRTSAAAKLHPIITVVRPAAAACTPPHLWA
jgi:hypothetical protein